MRRRIQIFDSSLRDGAQGEGVAFSVEDKLSIVRALDAIGVAYIEAGNPGSNPKDLEFFDRAAGLKLEHAKLCAFGSTRRRDTDVSQDANVQSLLRANTQTVVIFGKAWDLHVTDVLHTSLGENLNMIRDTVSFFKEKGKEVVFDAEHFFDGYKENADYALSALSAAQEGGADSLCLCDTNGGSDCAFVRDVTGLVVEGFDLPIGIHCHNDMGLAVANSMLAVEAGATSVQGTFIGIGERCGNTNLSTVIGNLQLKQGYECIPDELMPELTSCARLVADIANIVMSSSEPYVGRSAFAHKGGMHIDGVSKVSRSFEHVSPKSVGNRRRFLMSEVGGRTTLLKMLGRIAPHLTKDSPETKALMQTLKELEHEGYQFEAAESSFELVIRKHLGLFDPFFELVHYKITGEQPAEDKDCCSTAVIKVSVGDQTEITAAQGDGPVHALDRALRKALTIFYPSLAQARLTDYKVRVLEPAAATAATVRVLLESSDGDDVWTTVGVSTDIIEASWIALADSIRYKLMKDQLKGEEKSKGERKMN